MIALVSFDRHNKAPYPGGLSNRNSLLTVLEAEGPRASCQPHWLSGEALLQAHTMALSSLSSYDTNPSALGLHLKPSFIFISPFPKQPHWGLRT